MYAVFIDELPPSQDSVAVAAGDAESNVNALDDEQCDTNVLDDKQCDTTVSDADEQKDIVDDGNANMPVNLVNRSCRKGGESADSMSPLQA